MMSTIDELQAEQAKFLASGEMHFPDGTGREGDREMNIMVKVAVAKLEQKGMATWREVITDFMADVYAADTDQELRKALLRLATMATLWIRDIDGREP